MNTEALKIIKAWYQVSQENKLPVLSDHEMAYFRFMALWLAFNSFLTQTYQDIPGDKEKVRAFANEPKNANYHKYNLKDENYKAKISVIQEKGVKDMRIGSSRKFHINNQECLCELMDCIYQIRCNFFHGQKSVVDGRDINLVRSADYIVAKLINRYIDK